MADYEALKRRVQELAGQTWDEAAIKDWFDRLDEEGIPEKTLLYGEIVADKVTVLDRVQRKGEESEFLSHS